MFSIRQCTKNTQGECISGFALLWPNFFHFSGVFLPSAMLQTSLSLNPNPIESITNNQKYQKQKEKIIFQPSYKIKQIMCYLISFSFSASPSYQNFETCPFPKKLKKRLHPPCQSMILPSSGSKSLRIYASVPLVHKLNYLNWLANQKIINNQNVHKMQARSIKLLSPKSKYP